ncbi:MAG: ferrochelatase [Candidatus Kariarchaeaceae archaeon]
MVKHEKKIGLVLLNMGAPVNQGAIKPFLINLFSDPKLVQLPFFIKPFQKLLARIVTRSRGLKTREKYQKIGGGSPLLEYTQRFAENLTKQLKEQGVNVSTVLSMRYSPPRADEAVQKLQEEDVKKVILFTQYPHYSISTTGSSFYDFYKAVKRANFELEIVEIKQWSHEKEYINWWVRELKTLFVEKALDMDKSLHVIFSAHGLPQKYIDQGKKYTEDLEKTVELVLKELGTLGESFTSHLSYHGQTGPVEWTRPYTEDLIDEIALKKPNAIIIVPIGFVVDNIETLYDIDIVFKEQVISHNKTSFFRVKVPNDDPIYCQSVATLILKHLIKSS